MRVLCTSTPMEGVVGPVLPIARALRERGHEVLLAVGPDVQGRVEGEGFEAIVVGPPAMEAFVRTMADPAAAESPGASAKSGPLGIGVPGGRPGSPAGLVGGCTSMASFVPSRVVRYVYPLSGIDWL